MRTLAFWLCVAPALSSPAAAQVTSPATERFYLNLNAGVTLASGVVEGAASRELYDEIATLAFTLPRASAWLAEASGGFRLGGDVYAGVSIARTTSQVDGRYDASIPDPVFFNRHRLTSGPLDRFAQHATLFSPHLVWSAAITDRFDLTSAVGLAIAHVRQDVASDFTVTPGTQDLVLRRSQESGTAFGPFIAFDLILNVRPRYGIGLFARYAGATAALPSTRVKIGGVQGGAGLRLRF